MKKQKFIHYFLLMTTITLVGCQTTSSVITKDGMSKPTIPSSLPRVQTQRPCWTNLSQIVEKRRQKTFILAMGANTGDLQKANDDAERFQKAMQKRFTSATHICFLKDVYRAEFEQALTGLKPLVKADDRVIIFFSGHGSVIKDNDGDEKINNSDDNLDEVFIPVDVKDLEGPNRNNVVTDDDFIKWVNALPTKRIITFIDACHSGGMNLGPEDDMKPNKLRVKFFFNGRIGSGRSSPIYKKPSKPTAGGLEQRIKGVVLAATQEEKMACENDEGGIFTTNFLQQLQHQPKASFDKLFKDTQTQMQHPKILCDRDYQVPNMIGKFLPGD
jgi:hypothetical protein